MDTQHHSTMNYEEIARQMRQYEQKHEQTIPDRRWMVARLDGNNFSTFTAQHYQKPFDYHFYEVMLKLAEYLMEQFSALYAYVASDEISLVFAPEWATFNRRAEKATTLLSGKASAYFTLTTQNIAAFDARILSFEQLNDVCLYFDWRLTDVERCALQTCTYWTLRRTRTASQATRLLNKASVAEKLNILRQYDIDYDVLPIWQRQGTGLYWQSYQKEGYNPITEQTVLADRRRIVQFSDFRSRDDYQFWLAELFAEAYQPIN